MNSRKILLHYLKTNNNLNIHEDIYEDIYESSFLLKTSRLVYDEETIFVSNNQNKFFAIDSKNGFIKWVQTINSYLEPTIIENLVLTVSREGYFFVIDKINGNILRSTNIFSFLYLLYTISSFLYILYLLIV